MEIEKLEKNKYFSFAKNLGIAAVAGLAAGAGAAEISSLITDNKTATAIVSTFSEYVAAYAAFLPLHARDNQDIYRTAEGKFKWRAFIKDQAKLAGGFVILDMAYLTGRPFLAKEFLDYGITPSQASLYADAISYPSLMAAAFPIAKFTGNIKSKEKRLEDRLEK